jgi:transcriptional regulator with XRE-family HTH domain
MVEEWERDLIEELKDPEFAEMYGADRTKSSFGLAILHARQNANMTQKQFSEKLGVSQPYIAQIESGETNPTLEAAGKMLAAIGLKMIINVEPLGPREDSQPDAKIRYFAAGVGAHPVRRVRPISEIKK